MSHIYDSRYGLSLGDPDADPLGTHVPVAAETLQAARAEMIVSASGWRKVFAADGSEGSETEDISPADRELAALAGAAFCGYISQHLEKTRQTVLLAVDSRPTGGVLADILLRILSAHGFAVEYLFISPIPEVVAYTRSSDHIGAFLYVSASHNPVGHNGIKFGLAGQGVLPGSESAKVASNFDRLCEDEEARREAASAVRSVASAGVARILSAVDSHKARAHSAYRAFALDVADGPAGPGTALEAIAEGVGRVGCGVLIDFNGSARTTSVDATLLREMGITVKTLNALPREINHQILPEGAGLEPAQSALFSTAQQDSRFSLAYVPDNDGDRGNLVFAGARTALSAQEVFALAVTAELSWLSLAGLEASPSTPWAVVVNGPTSLRIERIAAAFDAEVHRCEVGEANVVEAASALRKRGYLVRVLGEGSNGGNILHPSRVRDPLATVFAFLKLLYAHRGTNADLFSEWCRRSSQLSAYRPDYTLEHVRETLPAFQTTATGSTAAKLRIRTPDHETLKQRYLDVFAAEWETHRSSLEQRYGIVRAQEIRYEGTSAIVGRSFAAQTEHEGTGRAEVQAHKELAGGTAQHEKTGSGDGRRPSKHGNSPGGFKVQFYARDDRPVGYLWMRGSGTEPVFRAVVDIELPRPMADTRTSVATAEEELLRWHRSMIEQADGKEGATS